MDLFNFAGRLLQQSDESSDEEAPLLEDEELDFEEEVAESSNHDEEEHTDTENEDGEDDASRSGNEVATQSSQSWWKKKKKKKTKFDISLPARHLYLGEMEEDRPANMEDEETTPTLPLLCIPSRILFPGETLPMHIYNPHMIQMLRDASTRGKSVAICTDLRLRHAPDHQARPTQQELSQVGTTAEVVAFKEEESQYYYGPCFVVKFLGRQRFKLLELHKKVNGLMDCSVEILPEATLPPRPLHLFSCPSHIFSSCHAVQLLARQADCTIHTCTQLELCRKKLQHPYLSGSISSVPSWVYDQYDFDYLREQLMMEQELKTFQSEDSQSARLPNDVISLSYWLARRLPTDETGKLKLLSINCPTLRLVKGLQILKEFTDLRCVDCDASITTKSHIFSMSVEGPLAAYVNPGGYIHDTLTVTEAKGVKKHGLPSTQHSWFPGYKWTILNCQSCGQHKGWCFEATKKHLIPAKFYGLTRAGLVLASVKQQKAKGAG